MSRWGRIPADGKLDVRKVPDTFGVTDMKSILAILLFAGSSIAASAGLTVFAAASTTEVMKALAAAYEESGGEEIRFNFAGSGALVRQISSGAPADLFVSAHVKWMDFLEYRDLLAEDTRTVVACNSLVLIAPTGSTLTFEDFPGNLKGRLGVGDFRSVPAGAYAEAALTSLGWLDELQGRLVMGANVRTVLMYVERGEVDAGIVYRTDAMLSDKIRMVGTFPEDSHPSIVYPAACMKSAGPQARAFLDFILSDTGQAVWKKYGFTPAMR